MEVLQCKNTPIGFVTSGDFSCMIFLIWLVQSMSITQVGRMYSNSPPLRFIAHEFVVGHCLPYIHLTSALHDKCSRPSLLFVTLPLSCIICHLWSKSVRFYKESACNKQSTWHLWFALLNPSRNHRVSRGVGMLASQLSTLYYIIMPETLDTCSSYSRKTLNMCITVLCCHSLIAEITR